MKKILFIAIAVFGLVACKTTTKSSSITKVPEMVTYTNTIQKLVRKKCVNCHQGYEAAGSLQLQTYAQVKAAAQNGTLLQRIEDVYKPMPKSGLMSQEKIDLFKKWVQNNYAE